ncbi:uncharacterized protein LOC132382297 isoform X1 [Hypanus sabinus]|uniref:uncharacterized protein LOC132382297 isoform X1 n=1 Tax=Hypanus sabinus TaxID=79690 RepID=UPI0028C49CF5|nr:uncharacterized protein LOC132382297 isoform X1 [Hypanus sabinus]XP_059808404.1 uncharacterized protein LOC132382297 isoform X1 [Hypanus sabinus]XP_059808405.1 uncharacterized protein LOC132382297 isoform X1 [Hypanus sabinus]XP_059808406.1 uncharacterized protein LOC132382297 isoform X1 [Hypanus sabinus]
MGNMMSGSSEEREHLLPNLTPRHRELVPTLCGPIRQCSELSCSEKSYITVAVFSLLVVLGTNIASIVHQSKAEKTELDWEEVAISVIQLIGVVFCVYYVLRGVLQEKQLELVAFVLSILLVLVRSIVNFIVARPEEKKSVQVRFGCSVVLGVSLMIISIIHLMKRDGYMTFRVAGALERGQSRYITQTLCFSLVTFDLQAQLCLYILLIALPLHLSLCNTIILAVGILWAIIKAALGLTAEERIESKESKKDKNKNRYSLKKILRENKHLIRMFLVLNLPELAYLCYLIYLITMVWICQGTNILKADGIIGEVIAVSVKFGLLHSMLRASGYFGDGIPERASASTSSHP